MRCHPFLYCLPFALAGAGLFSADRYLGGEWLDFQTLETKAELKAELNTDEKTLFVHGLFIDRRSSIQGSGTAGGVEIQEDRESGLSFAGGPLRAAGFAYSLADPFGKALHTGARRAVSGYALDTSAAATKQPSVSVSIGGDKAPPAWFRLTAAKVSGDRGSAIATLGGGSEGVFAVRAEAFFTQGILGARRSETWFSPAPPLPERRHSLGALSIVVDAFESQCYFGGAYSDAEAQGKGAYLAAVADLVFGPFRVVAGTDAATPRFIDTTGEETGKKIRSILHLRHAGPKGGSLLVRAESVFEGETANPKELTLDGAYRFAPRESPSFFRLLEMSAEAAKAVQESEKHGYRLKTGARLGLGPAIATLGTSLMMDADMRRNECGLSTKTDFSIGKFSVSVSAGAFADEAWKPKWAGSLGVAATVAGGLIMARWETDEPACWERLVGVLPSKSPLGPWSFSLSWRFRERLQTGPLLLKQGPQTPRVEHGIPVRKVVE